MDAARWLGVTLDRLDAGGLRAGEDPVPTVRDGAVPEEAEVGQARTCLMNLFPCSYFSRPWDSARISLERQILSGHDSAACVPMWTIESEGVEHPIRAASDSIATTQILRAIGSKLANLDRWNPPPDWQDRATGEF